MGVLYVSSVDDSITLPQLFFPVLVSLQVAYMLGQFTSAIGESRRKHRYPPPLTIEPGAPEEFVRVFRAHQNTVEVIPMFLPAVWAFAIFTSPVGAWIFGWLWVRTRYAYFRGYSDDAKLRLRPFYRGIRINILLLVGALLGMARFALVWFDRFMMFLSED